MKKSILVTISVMMALSMLLVGCAGTPSAAPPADTSTPQADNTPSEGGNAAYEEGYVPESGEAIFDDRYERTEGSRIIVHKETGRKIDLDNLLIVGVNKATGAFFWNSGEDESNRWAGQDGKVDMRWIPPTSFDAAAQMAALSDAIALDPDVLMVAPIAGEAVNEAVAEAKKRGTLVLGFEASDSMDNIDYYVDAFEGQRFVHMFVDNIASMMEKKGFEEINYALWVGKLTTAYQVDYCNWFYEYAAEKYPNMHCMLEKGAWLETNDNEEAGYESAKQVLLANSEVNLLWTPSSGGALGLARAIEELGLTGKVYTSAQSRPSASKLALDNGTYLFSAIMYPGACWYAMCQVARNVLEGKPVDNGNNLGIEGFENIIVKGKHVYGDGWYYMDPNTIDSVVAKFPDY